RWAALVFGSDLLYELSEEEMMPLAMLGRAVSPVTSYLAIEPGVRPSTEGLDEHEGGGGQGFGIGLGSASGVVHGSGYGFQIDKRAFLRDALAKGLAACGGAGRKVKVRVESTLREVVHVRAAIDGDKAADDKLRNCVEEAAWALELPEVFRA